LSLPNLQSLPLLEDAAPTFESLGQGVIEFDQTATVETVITMEEGSGSEDRQDAESEPKQDNTSNH
jgi:segregation and condensation protein B